MMNRLQSLFNRLAGISNREVSLLAENGRNCQSVSFSALEKPACWRRRSRNPALTPGVSRESIH